MRALECAVKDELQKRTWEDHTATILWCLGRTLAGDTWTLPSYIDSMYPSVIKKDNRTGAEIIRDIKARLN